MDLPLFEDSLDLLSSSSLVGAIAMVASGILAADFVGLSMRLDTSHRYLVFIESIGEGNINVTPTALGNTLSTVKVLFATRTSVSKPGVSL